MKKSVDRKNRKNIYLLGSSSMFNDISSEMITPILPFYITALGGTGLAVGALSGLREGLSSIFKILGGWLSDRAGKRKPFVFFGYIISFISRFLLLLASSWQWILGFVSFERLGKLRDAPRDAMIASYGNHRGKNFGIHQMMDSLGAIIGIFLVIFLLYKYNFGFKNIILIAAMISVLSLIPIIFVKENKDSKTKKGLLQGVKSLNKKLKYFIFVVSIFTLANFGLNMFLLLKAKELTGSTLASLGMYAIFNIVSVAFLIPFGRLSDSIGRKKVLIMGYILFFVLAIGLIFLNSFASMIIFFVIYGLVFAITQSNHRAFASDLSGKLKGTTMGLYHSVIGIVNIPAGIIAGLLWDFNPKTMFIYLSVVSLISIILLFFVKEGNEYKR